MINSICVLLISSHFIFIVAAYNPYAFNDDIFNGLQMNFMNDRSPLHQVSSFFDRAHPFDQMQSFAADAGARAMRRTGAMPFAASRHHKRHIGRQNIRPNNAGFNGVARFHSESNRLNTQRPVSPGDAGRHPDWAAGGPGHALPQDHRTHPEKAFFGANGRLSDALAHIPRETKHQPTGHKHGSLTAAHIHDHNVDNVQLPSGVPHPQREPGAQFIKERLGHENSDGKPYGSKIKYSFRDPKAPNNYMEVTEVRMSMNRQYTHDHKDKHSEGKKESNGGAHHPGPPPLPPPPMPPHPMKPVASSFSPRSTVANSFGRDDMDHFFSSNNDNSGSRYNSDLFNLPSGQDSVARGDFKCNHPSHGENEYNSPIADETSGVARNAFDQLYSMFTRSAESSHSVSSLFNGNSSPSRSQVDSFFSHSFFDDAYSF